MPGPDNRKGKLPYASELFGIYQPLLGWKSKLIAERFKSRRSESVRALAVKMTAVRPRITLVSDSAAILRRSPNPFDGVELSGLSPQRFSDKKERYIAAEIDSCVARLVSAKLEEYPPKDWSAIASYSHMQEALDYLRELVRSPSWPDREPELVPYIRGFVSRANVEAVGGVELAIRALFEREATVAGYIAFLADHSTEGLSDLFYRSPRVDALRSIEAQDQLLNFGENAYEAVLSPIGIVHLFRQYFFEFDSFLGPAVGHTWLSPGGKVELVEASTRRTFTERTFDVSMETTVRTEHGLTNQDDLSDAVREENRRDTKFGFSNVANYSAPFSSGTATASFSLDNAKVTARETTHKQMRQQSERLTNELRKTFRTTFRTSTENTDTSSKSYVLINQTDKLVNYELRRKMRKVGVQVQDVGTQLCWTAFVDDPGRSLGVSKLVHIASRPEMGDLPEPEAPELLTTVSQQVTIPIPFTGINTSDTNNAYTDGVETNVGTFNDDTENIVADFPQRATFNKPHYTLLQITLESEGVDAALSYADLVSEEGSSAGTFTIHLDYVNWRGLSTIPVKATLIWAPSDAARAAANAEYLDRKKNYSAERARRFKEAYYEAARERIVAASEVAARPSEDLREEERVVVFRSLISQLMSVGQGNEHVTSELVRSIFDVDKMLYFVAPEWWAPRLHRSKQHLGQYAATASFRLRGRSPAASEGALTAPTLMGDGPSSDDADSPPKAGTSQIPAEHVVDWGGAREANRDNYYITEESVPAKLGSSLGWLLQLDGDNMRNAMLNSPWVKTVIPIRVGREREALHWLRRAQVEGADGLDSKYSAASNDPQELQSTEGHTVSVAEALDYLIDRIQEYNEAASTPVVPNLSDASDSSNHFSGSLPTEAVFEHGFYPLEGGTRFDADGSSQAIVSQWTEILPTDQIVALEVEYDPITLEVKSPPSSPPI